MKKILMFIIGFMMFISTVYASPANDSFLDDNLYKCIIDAYNLNSSEKKDYSYSILPEELLSITSLDCSKYKGSITDLTGLNKLISLTSLNLSGNTFWGGSLRLNNTEGTLRSNLKLPSTLSITNKSYKIDNEKIVKIENDKVYPLSKGSTYITMTGYIASNSITEKYLVTVTDGTTTVTNNNVKKSSNTKLSSLYLSQGEFKFDSDVKKYSTIVDSSVSSVKINATLLDKKAKFVTNYGPRTVNLKSGTNEFDVKVQAEDGTIGTYIISIIRSDGKDNNNKLANIELSVGKIDFQSDVYSYNFSVASNVDEIDIKAVTDSPLAKVTITDISGKESADKITSKLKVGSNRISIKTTSESGSLGEYVLVITRENYDSKDNYLSGLVIKDYDIDFKRDKYNYEINLNNESTLNITPTLENTESNYSIINNTNLKDGSKILVQVSDKEGSSRTYTILVHKKSVASFDFINNLPIKWIILGLEFIVIIILLIVIISRMGNRPRKPKRVRHVNKVRPVKPERPKNLGNSNSVTCSNCNTINDIKSKTCYVCGNELK